MKPVLNERYAEKTPQTEKGKQIEMISEREKELGKGESKGGRVKTRG